MKNFIHLSVIILVGLIHLTHGCDITVSCDGKEDVQYYGDDCGKYVAPSATGLCSMVQDHIGQSSNDPPPRPQVMLTHDQCTKTLMVKWCNNGQNINQIKQYEVGILPEFDMTPTTLWFNISLDITSVFSLDFQTRLCFTHEYPATDSLETDNIEVFVYALPAKLDPKLDANYEYEKLTVRKCNPYNWSTSTQFPIMTTTSTVADNRKSNLILTLTIVGIAIILGCSATALVLIWMLRRKQTATREGIQLMILMSNDESADSQYMKAAQMFSTKMSELFQVKFLQWEKEDLAVLGLGSWFNFNLTTNTKIILIPSPTLEENASLSNRSDNLLLRLLHNRHVIVAQFGSSKNNQVLEQLNHKQCYKFPEEISKFNRHILSNQLTTFEMQEIIRPLAEIAARIQRRSQGQHVSIETTSLISNNH